MTTGVGVIPVDSYRRPLNAAVGARSSSLPLVAFRGLWDKFDGPGTLGSLRRAYRRGVPSLARVGVSGLALRDVLELVSDPVINRRHEPVYLVAPTLPDLTPILATLQTPIPLVLAVEAGMVPTAWRVYRWTSNGWQTAGTYLPACESPSTMVRAGGTGERLLLESVNTADTIDARRALEGQDDDARLASVRAMAGMAMTLIRVSDMVELDQLDRTIREGM